MMRVGNLTQVTDALGHKTSYVYDKNNNRTEFVNANGKATKYSFNAVNRLSKSPMRWRMRPPTFMTR